jgi:hypothetical protein
MNDLTVLNDAFGAQGPPSEAASTRARTALLARAAERSFRPTRLGTRIAAAAALAATIVAGTAVLDPRTSEVESAVAAVRKAGTLTAASAERSGTAVVRIRHDGEIWAGTTIRWNGDDIALSDGVPRRAPARAGGELLVVDGIMYGIEHGDGWVVLGPPESVDPDSGTTPAEYLAAVRDDVGGATLRRITNGMTGLTSSRLDDGSTVYRGAVAAGLIARETGFKGGQTIRVLPFGYVAHDQAADPAALLDAAVTVGADGVVRRIAVSWPGWSYTVTYSELGATPAPAAPENARPLRRR